MKGRIVIIIILLITSYGIINTEGHVLTFDTQPYLRI